MRDIILESLFINLLEVTPLLEKEGCPKGGVVVKQNLPIAKILTEDSYFAVKLNLCNFTVA